jgi:hypothetical protein
VTDALSSDTTPARAPAEVSTDQRAPDWILAYAADVRDLIDGDPSIGGRCEYKEPYRIARVYLARGHSDAAYREFVMHELLHAALAPMDYAAITAVRLVPKPQRKVAQALINDGCERVVVALTAALVKVKLAQPPAEPKEGS